MRCLKYVDWHIHFLSFGNKHDRSTKTGEYMLLVCGEKHDKFPLKSGYTLCLLLVTSRTSFSSAETGVYILLGIGEKQKNNAA